MSSQADKEAAAAFFGYASWKDSQENGGSAGPKVTEKLADFLAEHRSEQEQLLRDAWGALNFILAFYEPGQKYLDTEAWKVCEAGARRVHKKLAEALK